MIVKEYTEDFYRLNNKTGQRERDEEKVAKLRGRAKIEVPMYEGNLDADELLDWIRSMDKHFDYEDVNEEKKVK